MDTIIQHHFIATIHLQPEIRWWTGIGEIVLPDGTYRGMPIINISSTEESVGAPDNRLQVSIDTNPPPSAPAQLVQALRDLRVNVLQGLGFREVTLRRIVSNDEGRTWQILPWKFFGRLSNSQIRDGVWSVDIETFTGDTDRGRPLMWSDSTQLSRFPGDKGFNFTRVLSRGIQTPWPF